MENAMGKFLYVPDAMPADEAEALLSRLAELVPKVDHYIARGRLNEAIADLSNEVDTIEKGYRGPEPQ